MCQEEGPVSAVVEAVRSLIQKGRIGVPIKIVRETLNALWMPFALVLFMGE